MKRFASIEWSDCKTVIDSNDATESLNILTCKSIALLRESVISMCLFTCDHTNSGLVDLLDYYVKTAH